MSTPLDYHFMLNALEAGTLVAVGAGSIGWWMVLRRQSFAGHTLSVVAFPGASGAAWLGLPAAAGYFGFCVAAAVAIAAAGRGRDPARGGFSGESAVIGTVQAFALACGFLFSALYHGLLGGVTALLFGSLFGVSDAQVAVLAATTAATLAALAVIGRPLLFASIDPDVAAARGVRVRRLDVAFLVLLGVAVAAAAQITGALLVFAVLVMPAAAAQAVATRPATSLALTGVLAVAVVWAGLLSAYYLPYPSGFFTTTYGFAAYVAAVGARRWVPALR